MICHYWLFNQGFKFEDTVCNGCHVFTMLCFNIRDIIHNISKSEAINLLENSFLENGGYVLKNIALIFSLFRTVFFTFFV